MTPASTWTINHNMNKRPSVVTVDSTNRVVIGEVQYVDSNNLIVSSRGGFAGQAFLNLLLTRGLAMLFLAPIDLNTQELRKPSSRIYRHRRAPARGQIYFDTTLGNHLFVYTPAPAGSRRRGSPGAAAAR